MSPLAGADTPDSPMADLSHNDNTVLHTSHLDKALVVLSTYTILTAANAAPDRTDLRAKSDKGRAPNCTTDMNEADTNNACNS